MSTTEKHYKVVTGQNIDEKGKFANENLLNNP
jgi:hypothetical protein